MPNQVWAVDITYIKMGHSHMYLTVIIDWYSRFVVGWELSEQPGYGTGTGSDETSYSNIWSSGNHQLRPGQPVYE